MMFSNLSARVLSRCGFHLLRQVGAGSAKSERQHPEVLNGGSRSVSNRFSLVKRKSRELWDRWVACALRAARFLRHEQDNSNTLMPLSTVSDSLISLGMMGVYKKPADTHAGHITTGGGFFCMDVKEIRLLNLNTWLNRKGVTQPL